MICRMFQKPGGGAKLELKAKILPLKRYDMVCVGIQKPGGGAKLKYKILRLNDMQDRMFQKPGGGAKLEIKAKILPL